MSSEILPRAHRSQHLLIVATMAPVFIGAVTSYFFWGVLVTQTYYYYKTYRKTDPLWVKLSVATIFILDILQSCSVSEGGWRYLVDLWGDPLVGTKRSGFGADWAFLMDRFAAACVQGFYAQKIWVLYAGPYQYVLVLTIVSLALTQVIAGIIITAGNITHHQTLVTFGRGRGVIVTGNVAAAATDVLIVILMISKLNQRRTGFKDTDDIISKVIRIVLPTGLATAVIQLMLLGVYLGWPHDTYFVALLLVAPKIFSNSMLALLNSRRVAGSDSEVQEPISSTSLNIRTVQTVASDFDHKDLRRHELRAMPIEFDQKGSD